jgi:hypothetical protein
MECGGLPCLPRASRGASKGLFTQCGAEGPPLFLLPHPVYPVYPELRGEPRRACLPRVSRGHRFSSCPTPFTLFTPGFEGSVEGPPSPPNLCALSVSAFNSSLFFDSGMDREQTPFDIRPEAKLFRINTCKAVSKQTTLTAFRINSSWGRPHFAQFWCNVTPFRINTCKSVSKQTTLTSFRMNTY